MRLEVTSALTPAKETFVFHRDFVRNPGRGSATGTPLKLLERVFAFVSLGPRGANGLVSRSGEDLSYAVERFSLSCGRGSG